MNNLISNLNIRKKIIVIGSYIGMCCLIIGLVSVFSTLRIVQTGSIDTARRTIIVIVCIMVFGITSGWIVLYQISKNIYVPMQKFAVVAKMIAVGDYDINDVLGEEGQKYRERKDEIGMVGEAFHQVIANTIEQSSLTEKIAHGDLTVTAKMRSENDIMSKSTADLVQQLRGLVSNIVYSADQIKSNAEIGANASAVLSQGAEEQASSIEQLTASLEVITIQTTQNAQNAEQADVLAKNAKTNAEIGNSQMKEMLQAMEEINVSSNNINSIIKVIEDIAFQTNILALNAAVEAARAGQYGKGFAVVAEEVRNLAARSSKAASETTALIEGSISKVNAGTKIAESTAKALNNIVIDVDKTANLVDTISRASNQQAAAIEQVNQGIAQISQVVQTNAANSEESAAGSEELSAQATQLSEFVQIFKLGDGKSAKSIDYINLSNPDNSKLMNDIIDLDSNKLAVAVSDNEFGKY